MSPTVQYPDYDSLQNDLATRQAVICPSEMHGIVTGLIAGSRQYNVDAWLAFLLHEMDVDEKTEVDDLFLVHQLVNATLEYIGDMALELPIYLPEDDAPMKMRMQALSAWCQGYLYGLGVSQVGDAWLEGKQIQEVFEDITAIAREPLEVLESALENEDTEKDYFELVEYLKVAAALIFATLYDYNQEDVAVSVQ